MTKKAKKVKKLFPAEKKAAWLKALRSGQYRQCGYKLYDKYTDTYCCLGVLKKVVGKVGKSRLNGAYAHMLDPDTEEKCVHMNDNLGLSFKQIANRLAKMKIYGR